MIVGNERASCLVCGGGAAIRFRLRHIWHQPTGSDRQIFWCEACDFGLLHPRPSREELCRFYEGAYYTHCEPGKVEPPPGFLARIRIHLAWRADRGRGITAQSIHELSGGFGLSVCDIGCGGGELLGELKRHGHHVAGVEPDEMARKQASTQGVTVYPGSAESLPAELGSESFDVVVMKQSLEHSVDPLVALSEARRILKPEGRLLVDVPNNAASMARRSGPAWFHCDAGRHLSFFTPKSLILLLERAGFSVESLLFSGYVSQFTDSRIKAEQEVWDLLYGRVEGVRAPRRNSHRRAWADLVKSILARPSSKYEVLGAIASRR